MKISSQSEPEEKYLTLAEFEKFKQELELKFFLKQDLLEANKFQEGIKTYLYHIKTKLGI